MRLIKAAIRNLSRTVHRGLRGAASSGLSRTVQSLDKPILVICITDGESVRELCRQASEKKPAAWQISAVAPCGLMYRCLCGLGSSC